MILVHICCSVDSHFFLESLQKDYPDEKLIGYFYDPNIHPYSEYRLRHLDVEYSCKKLNIELHEGPYDLENWLSLTKGLENEPEKGDRCTVCFHTRLDTSIQKAKELGADKFTTSLLISPKKSQEKLDKIGNELAKKFGMEWIFKDYRVGSGMQLQGLAVKENNLYRQNYCGCLFALNAQRDQQEKLADELISSIGQQILPESIEERIKLYKIRNSLENPQIIKQRFLNYRLLNAKVESKKNTIPSYFLCYSTIQNYKSSGRVEYTINDIHYFNRNEIKLITLHTFNKIANTLYDSVLELIYNPLQFEDELQVRNKIVLNSFYDLSCVIVLDSIEDEKYDIYCNSKVYDDVKEVIL